MVSGAERVATEREVERMLKGSGGRAGVEWAVSGERKSDQWKGWWMVEWAVCG